MPAARGSRQTIKVVRETTYGTTPTNPTLLALPIVNFTRNVNRGLIQSNQIRSHPFTDRLMKGQLSADFDLQYELQDDTHDVLLSTFCGTTDWAANAIKITDSLQGLSMEATAGDLSLHDQFAGVYLGSMEVNFPAEENGIITVSMNGMAKTVDLDVATSIIGTGAITPAPDVDPMVFGDAICTIGGSARPITALNIRAEREVNPLLVLGAFNPREYIPGGVTVTGQVTIPLENNTESTQLENFTDVAIVARGVSGLGWREFTLPKVNFSRMGRQVQDRGVILQTIDWTAKYDATLASVLGITRSA